MSPRVLCRIILQILEILLKTISNKRASFFYKYKKVLRKKRFIFKVRILKNIVQVDWFPGGIFIRLMFVLAISHWFLWSPMNTPGWWRGRRAPGPTSTRCSERTRHCSTDETSSRASLCCTGSPNTVTTESSTRYGTQLAVSPVRFALCKNRVHSKKK